ncbi:MULTISPECIES: hypothetical protein [Maribacter]|uniref:Uncharacterized protein n=2 Tax=Maribacter cobaltidurans TaxID=1178778 RepID=A0ABU7ISX9_9FLAO|nr:MULTISPECIES: hypothetical protein [Maribacter]ASV32353.1 hypothetical protein CJ263_20150 [Maribacter cobaltidurans]MDC6388700.1 hypothetical protein [Maribacter sp. PR1]MEE1976089.1 hypothetical protein [Maribacter cobaltidurans]GGD94458.1 hypothetical protein GCM10011412_35570 [Maribacter cobaltidurans]
MEKQAEKQIEKVFVNVSQVWFKGEAISKDQDTYKVKTDDGRTFTMPKMNEEGGKNEDIQIRENLDHQFAKEDVKRRLEGAYISFQKLDDNVQESLLEGKERLIKTTYISDGQLKSSVKMVQMVYNPNTGSKLDVQIRRNEQIKLEDANAYQYQFTKEEYNAMVKEGQTIQFTGTSLNGDTFQKLAYYEPRLNDIRTKPAVSANMYVLGQQLTKEQADTMNKGEEVKITIRKTKKGPLTYMVRWSAKGQRFLYRDLEKAKLKDMEVKAGTTLDSEKKKKQPSNAMSL